MDPQHDGLPRPTGNPPTPQLHHGHHATPLHPMPDTPVLLDPIRGLLQLSRWELEALYSLTCIYTTVDGIARPQIEAQHTRDREQGEQREEDLRTEIEQLHDSVTEKQTSIDGLRAKLADCEENFKTKKGQLEGQLTECQDENVDLQQQIAELETQKTLAEELQAQLSGGRTKLQQRNDDLQSELEKIRSEKTGLQQELEKQKQDLSALTADLATQRSGIEELQDKFDASDVAKTKAKEKLVSVEKKLKGALEAEQEQNNLNGQLTLELDEAKTAAKDRGKKIESLTNDNAGLNRRLEISLRNLEWWKKQNTALEANLKSCKEDLHVERANVDSLRNEKKKAEEENSETARDFLEVKKKKEDGEIKLEEEQAKASKLAEALAEKEAEAKALGEMVAQYESWHQSFPQTKSKATPARLSSGEDSKDSQCPRSASARTDVQNGRDNVEQGHQMEIDTPTSAGKTATVPSNPEQTTREPLAISEAATQQQLLPMSASLPTPRGSSQSPPNSTHTDTSTPTSLRGDSATRPTSTISNPSPVEQEGAPGSNVSRTTPSKAAKSAVHNHSSGNVMTVTMDGEEGTLLMRPSMSKGLKKPDFSSPSYRELPSFRKKGIANPVDPKSNTNDAQAGQGKKRKASDDLNDGDSPFRMGGGPRRKSSGGRGWSNTLIPH